MRSLPPDVLIFLSPSTFKRQFDPNTDPCADNSLCLNVGKIPLLKNVRTSLIDPDTPDSVKSKQSYDGSTWELVVSHSLGGVLTLQLTLIVFR